MPLNLTFLPILDDLGPGSILGWSPEYLLTEGKIDMFRNKIEIINTGLDFHEPLQKPIKAWTITFQFAFTLGLVLCNDFCYCLNVSFGYCSCRMAMRFLPPLVSLPTLWSLRTAGASRRFTHGFNRPKRECTVKKSTKLKQLHSCVWSLCIE